MISNPNLILYACIAKGTTVLAQFSREPDLEPFALQCIEKTPPYHSTFAHTVRKRTYIFFIEDPFLYFAIFDEDLVQSEGFGFLHRVKCAFKELIDDGDFLVDWDNLSSHFLQRQCDPIFRETLALDLSLVNSSPGPESNSSRNLSMDSEKAMKMAMAPLLGSNPGKGLMKKKRMCGESNWDANGGALENKVDVGHDMNGVCKDFSLPVQKSVHHDRQKAKQIWRKHVWVVLSLDLFVCSVLFVIWLLVCRGFHCVAG